MSAVISKATDVVAVLDSNLTQIFTDAHIIKLSVSEKSKVMSHPVETGAVIVDEIVFDPIEVKLTLTLKASGYRSTYQEIKQVYQTRSLLTVQTKSDSYDSLVIESMPHDEDGNVFDTISINLNLKEVKFVETEYESFKLNSVLKSTNVKKKDFQPCTPRADTTSEAIKKTSGLYDMFGWFRG